MDKAQAEIIEGRQLCEEAVEVLGEPGAQYRNRRGYFNPHPAIRRYITFHHPVYIQALYKKLEALERENRELRGLAKRS